MVVELVQFRHFIVIPSQGFTSHASCHMALQAKHSVLGLTGKESNKACSPGTTAVCSCFLGRSPVPEPLWYLRNAEQLHCHDHSDVPRDLLFFCTERQVQKLNGHRSKEEINTQNLLPRFRSRSLLEKKSRRKIFLFPLFPLPSKTHFALALQWVALGPDYNWAWMDNWFRLQWSVHFYQ